MKKSSVKPGTLLVNVDPNGKYKGYFNVILIIANHSNGDNLSCNLTQLSAYHPTIDNCTSFATFIVPIDDIYAGMFKVIEL